jgi:hypothetical protein
MVVRLGTDKSKVPWFGLVKINKILIQKHTERCLYGIFTLFVKTICILKWMKIYWNVTDVL